MKGRPKTVTLPAGSTKQLPASSFSFTALLPIQDVSGGAHTLFGPCIARDVANLIGINGKNIEIFPKNLNFVCDFFHFFGKKNSQR